MYRRSSTDPDPRTQFSRRLFVQGLAAGALTFTGGRSVARELAAMSREGAASPGIVPGSAGDGLSQSNILRGTVFDLEVASREVNFTGAPRTATVVNGAIPGPVLLWRQDDIVTVRVSNRLAVPTSIHWHGVLVPAAMDGVPGISFPGILPGASFAYRFRVQQSGTYWYHSHSRFQEQVGLYGPIVIEPRDGERQSADREHVLLLSDWTDIDPERIYRTLKRQSDYFNYGKRTIADLAADIRRNGLASTLAERRMWGAMRMDPTDLQDVSGHTYTYLLNGLTPAANWTGLFRRGERLRLRIINGSSMTFFDVRIPGLRLRVVAADGQAIEPVTVDEFRIAAGEVYDVMLEPRDDRAYTIFAQSVDRSGYARGTLAPAAGMQAEIPTLDPRPLLSMADMGMGAPQENSPRDMPSHDMSAHGMGEMAMSGMPHRPAAPRFGPDVDATAAEPSSRLDDPGVGLRDNGRRVLTYADLHTIGGPLDTRDAGREIRLHLTGHMQRYVWSFDGLKFSDSVPLRFQHGERLRIALVNDSMMAHPIHLHGMWSEVQTAEGRFLVRKHTTIVQPGQELRYEVTADALGRWAFHCHLLYHMEAGMFREVIVA
ncbi:MAG TPA: copper resistance system multicopper oxidase [Steroidobacteraceae bacterium]|nr:copper resistance system multicopper oxidase [Steroidobacteraceae bacterium]